MITLDMTLESDLRLNIACYVGLVFGDEAMIIVQAIADLDESMQVACATADHLNWQLF